jgi:hypothetical protein
MYGQQNGDILIFRTISIELMDMVIDQCKSMWPNERMVVLTSANRVGELTNDSRISETIPLPMGSKGFSRRIIINRRFQALIIPIANRRGSGYGNVFSAASCCLANEYYTMPYASKPNRVSMCTLRFYSLIETVLLSLSFPLAYLTAKMFL